MRNGVKSYTAHVDHCNRSVKGGKTGRTGHKCSPDHKSFTLFSPVNQV